MVRPLAVLLAAAVLAPDGAGAGSGDCALCHSEVAVRYRRSAHAFEDLVCVDCHGGDPATTDVGAAHRGLRTAVTRSGIPEFCGSCHSDPAAMAAYGLPADQLALYRISGHGRALAQGNLAAAVCTDCHGVHDIRPARDPASPTQARNVAAADCGPCHGEGGTGDDVLGEYADSVHHAALQSANPRAPTCVDCHGSHGAAPPGLGSVNRVCGQCHTQAREAFRHGPHAGAVAAGGAPQCATCHGNHRVRRATVRLWAACGDCHGDDAEAVRTGETIVTLIRQASNELASARESAAAARAVPLDVRDYEARLDLAATYLEQARPRTHSLDPETVEELTRKARSIAQQVESDVAGELRLLEDRDLVVLFVWLYIAVTVAALQLYRRSFH